MDSPRNALARWEQYRKAIRAHENTVMSAADEVYLAFYAAKLNEPENRSPAAVRRT